MNNEGMVAVQATRIDAILRPALNHWKSKGKAQFENDLREKALKSIRRKYLGRNTGPFWNRRRMTDEEVNMRALEDYNDELGPRLTDAMTLADREGDFLRIERIVKTVDGECGVSSPMFYVPTSLWALALANQPLKPVYTPAPAVTPSRWASPGPGSTSGSGGIGSGSPGFSTNEAKADKAPLGVPEDLRKYMSDDDLDDDEFGFGGFVPAKKDDKP